MRGYRGQQRLSYGAVDRYNSSESIRVPEYMVESRPTSVESLTEVTDAANSSAPTSSANSSVSNISMEPITLANSLNNARALFKKKSLVQLINSYIKAGIEEGKRQAKKYIRKALSFGVRSGYLTPADARGNVLRVCPTLVSSRTSDVESRRKRRIARRGDTRLMTIDDRKAMRRGVPKSKASRHDVRAEDATSRKRYRRHPTESPVRSFSAKNDGLRKSPESRRREKNKSRSSGARNNSKIDERADDKREQQRKRGDNGKVKKPVKRRRTALSPKRVEDDHVPVVENYVNASDRDRYKSNEDNYRAVNDRRKPSRERESRVEGQKISMSVDDNRDVERKDDSDNDDKSEEASIERDANGTTGETDV
ncbi:nipped-B-like protein [Odontomachus brunneus]|uniref:nipped-B-like protein n=1 Tax=Odontomachus brunneus TaxID=486640 RepID=UPI0013F25C03|nr:nipped-B-like protein [Odontomachus brunneus]